MQGQVNISMIKQNCVCVENHMLIVKIKAPKCTTASNGFINFWRGLKLLYCKDAYAIKANQGSLLNVQNLCRGSDASLIFWAFQRQKQIQRNFTILLICFQDVKKITER